MYSLMIAIRSANMQKTLLVKKSCEDSPIELRGLPLYDFINLKFITERTKLVILCVQSLLALQSTVQFERQSAFRDWN